MKQSRLRGSADDLVQERSIAVMGLHRKFNHHTGADAFAGGDIKLAFPLAEDIEPLMYIGYAVTFAGADIQLGQLLCRFGAIPLPLSSISTPKAREERHARMTRRFSVLSQYKMPWSNAFSTSGWSESLGIRHSIAA